MIVYKTTNILTGKVYVGKDLNNNPAYLGSGIKLIHAIKKHGREFFKKEILEECTDPETWVNREKYWIKVLDTIAHGYNIAEGGTGGNTRKGFSKEEKAEYLKRMQKGRRESNKVREAYDKRKGVPRPEHSQKLKELYRDGIITPHNLGKITPESTRQKISESNRGRKLTLEQKQKIAQAKFKSVNVYTLEGEYLETLQSIKQASEKYKVGRDSIYGCCVGKYKQGGGYRWEYSACEVK